MLSTKIILYALFFLIFFTNKTYTYNLDQAQISVYLSGAA